MDQQQDDNSTESGARRRNRGLGRRTLVTRADSVGAADHAWQLQAKCAGPFPNYFFPPTDRELPEHRAEREALAREVCRDCPVVQPCLDLAQALGEPDGIWGGMNERQRREHRARRALDTSRTSSRQA